jgi:hypothetical protein
MRTGIVVEMGAADRRRLTAIVADRNSPQKHVWRAEIVLLTADGLGTTEIMRRIGKAKTAVWRWQERFMRAGVDGLLRDKTRDPSDGPRTRTPSSPPPSVDTMYWIPSTRPAAYEGPRRVACCGRPPAAATAGAGGLRTSGAG